MSDGGGPLPSPEDLRGFFSAGLGQVESEGSDESVEVDEYDKKVQDRDINRLDQEHNQRKWFFRFAITLAVLCTLGSLGVVVWLTGRGTAPAAVYVAFVSGLSVEALGITGIMARHLFSRDAKPPEEKPKPPQPE